MTAHPSFIPDDGLTESLLCSALARMLKSSLTGEAESRKPTDQGAARNQVGTAADGIHLEEKHIHGTVAS